MKYNGLYYALFKGTMKKVLAERHGAAYARDIMRRSGPVYRELVEGMDDLGPGNPMTYNALFALAFIAPYVASGKKLPLETVQEMMRRSLYGVKFYFSRTDVNTERGKRAHKLSVTKYIRWYDEKKQRLYPSSFLVDEVGKPYEGACYYRITRCAICPYCDKLGVAEVMPYLCELDEVMVSLQHGVLHRENTIADGGPYCDYWIVGDRETPPTRGDAGGGKEE